MTTKGKRCVFPFKYDGNLYSACTKSSLDSRENELWCSISNTADGSMAHWGTCTDTPCGKLRGILFLRSYTFMIFSGFKV